MKKQSKWMKLTLLLVYLGSIHLIAGLAGMFHLWKAEPGSSYTFTLVGVVLLVWSGIRILKGKKQSETEIEKN